eukprot:SAG31_NODE_42396_length_272_cov_0.549133_1_plen_36_part_01
MHARMQRNAVYLRPYINTVRCSRDGRQPIIEPLNLA